jgi:hypothetical protein
MRAAASPTVFLLANLMAGCAAQSLVARKVAPGAVEDYELTLKYRSSDRPPFTQATRLTATVTSSAPFEEKIVLREMWRNEAGQHLDLTNLARSFGGFSMSLVPLEAEPAAPPNLTNIDPALLQPVLDVHSILAAARLQGGIGELRKVGDVRTLPHSKKSSWADGRLVILGENCLNVECRVMAADDAEVLLETSYEPPSASCLALSSPMMKPNVDGATPNNFELIQRANGRVMAMWGRERLVIRSHLRRSDGLLLRATMENDFKLRIAKDCDESLADCAMDLPLSIHRKVRLQRR